MNLQEAYSILDQVASAYKGTRSEHSALTEALRIFADLINKEVNRDLSQKQTTNQNNIPDTSMIK